MIMLKRLIAISVILLSVLACGQSDEEFDARVEAKVTEMLANIPDPTPIPEPTPITIPTPLPTGNASTTSNTYAYCNSMGI